MAEDGFNPEIQGAAIFDFVRGPLQQLRVAIGLPFVVHCMYRPPAYNKLVGGAEGSAHMAATGAAAIDFDLNGSMTCDQARQAIVQMGYLDQFGLRMEQRPGSDWVHIDNREPGQSGRFFVP